jgi:hypothetical protein
MTPHRLHIWPWSRRVGRLVLSNWLAITVGGRVFAWRALDPAELEHELEHVRQWRRYGILFPIAYVADSLRTRRRGGHWYRDNRYEVEARRAAESLTIR